MMFQPGRTASGSTSPKTMPAASAIEAIQGRKNNRRMVMPENPRDGGQRILLSIS
jgi:hypothetical protein